MTAEQLREPHEARPRARVRAWSGRAWREVPCFERDGLEPGAASPGPALVVEGHGVTVVEPGWRMWVDGARALRIDRDGR